MCLTQPAFERINFVQPEAEVVLPKDASQEVLEALLARSINGGRFGVKRLLWRMQRKNHVIDMHDVGSDGVSNRKR